MIGLTRPPNPSLLLNKTMPRTSRWGIAAISRSTGLSAEGDDKSPYAQRCAPHQDERHKPRKGGVGGLAGIGDRRLGGNADTSSGEPERDQRRDDPGCSSHNASRVVEGRIGVSYFMYYRMI
jgi:hypothetical protein